MNKNISRQQGRGTLKDLTFKILFHILVYRNSFSINRDNGYINEDRGNYKPSMEDKNYDCVGNEAVITDCSKNYDSCSSAGDFVGRTALNCNGKKQLFVLCF